MANLTITAASIIPGSGAKNIPGIAGATVTAGQVAAKDPATGKYVLADSNHATAALRRPAGVFLNGAADGQPVTIHTDGPLAFGAILTAGTDYWLSDTAGAICPRADVGSGELAVLLGLATSTTVLDVQIQNSGVTV